MLSSAGNLTRSSSSRSNFRVRRGRVQSAVIPRGREIKKLENQLKDYDDQVHRMEVEF